MKIMKMIMCMSHNAQHEEVDHNTVVPWLSEPQLSEHSIIELFRGHIFIMKIIIIYKMADLL